MLPLRRTGIKIFPYFGVYPNFPSPGYPLFNVVPGEGARPGAPGDGHPLKRYPVFAELKPRPDRIRQRSGFL
jgi:hypothetical protein